MSTTEITCAGCQFPLRPHLDGFVIDLEHDTVDRLRPELWGTARLDGRVYCPPNSYALNPGPHIPAEAVTA